MISAAEVKGKTKKDLTVEEVIDIIRDTPEINEILCGFAGDRQRS